MYHIDICTKHVIPCSNYMFMNWLLYRRSKGCGGVTGGKAANQSSQFESAFSTSVSVKTLDIFDEGLQCLNNCNHDTNVHS